MSYVGQDFGDKIAQMEYANIIHWCKIGYSPTVNSTESDIWSAAGVYGGGDFLTSDTQMELVGSENVNDIGTILRGSRTVPVTSDAGGSTTTLLDADVDFTAATAVAPGDFILLDPSGTTPEWGQVSSVAAHQLTFNSGFSSRGTGSARKYIILDYSAHTGAMAFKIEYLTNTHTPKVILIPANGTTVMPTLDDAGGNLTDLYRINHFEMICSGTLRKPSGNWTLRTAGGGTTWGYISLGYTRARNTIYTVPLGNTLYLTQFTVGWATPNDTKVQTARLYLRANIEPFTEFNNNKIFYPFAEATISNSEIIVPFAIPLRFPQRTDMKVSGVAVNPGAGPATCILRGYLVS